MNKRLETLKIETEKGQAGFSLRSSYGRVAGCAFLLALAGGIVEISHLASPHSFKSKPVAGMIFKIKRQDGVETIATLTKEEGVRSLACVDQQAAPQAGVAGPFTVHISHASITSNQLGVTHNGYRRATGDFSNNDQQERVAWAVFGAALANEDRDDEQSDRLVKACVRQVTGRSLEAPQSTLYQRLQERVPHF